MPSALSPFQMLDPQNLGAYKIVIVLSFGVVSFSSKSDPKRACSHLSVCFKGKNFTKLKMEASLLLMLPHALRDVFNLQDYDFIHDRKDFVCRILNYFFCWICPLSWKHQLSLH